MCSPWYDQVHRSTRESSHAPSHSELDIRGTLWLSHRGILWPATVRLLPLRALSGPEPHRYLSLSARRVFNTPKKKLSHSCRLDVGPGDTALPARAPDTCQTPNVHLDMETPIPVDVAQRPWNWTVGAAGWAITTATASACHVCPRPQKGRGTCKALDLRGQVFEEKSAHHKLLECRWMSHQTACPEATTLHHTTAPTSMRKQSRSPWEVKRRHPRLTTAQRACARDAARRQRASGWASGKR